MFPHTIPFGAGPRRLSSLRDRALNVWVVHAGEPIAGLDLGAPPHRYGMIVDALSAAGHQVTWWASTFQHLAKRHRFDEARTLPIGRRKTLRLLHAGPIYRRNVAFSRWLHHRALANEFRMAAPLEQTLPDVIVASLPTPELCAAAVDFGNGLGVPVVVDVQDPWPDIYLSLVPRSLHSVARVFMATEYDRLSRTMDGAAAITSVSDSFLKWGVAHRTRDWDVPQQVFPLGALSDRFKQGRVSLEQERTVRLRHGLPEEAKVVAFSGTFGHSYDLETIVQAAQLLRREGRTDIHFALAGDGDRMPEMKRRCAGLSNLTLMGWLDPSALTALLQTSAVGLCSYRRKATQSLPYKCFEYMAAGLPQISSLRGELAHLLQTQGIGRGYEAGSAVSMRNAIVALVDAPRVRTQMAIQARSLFQQRFDTSQIYPEMVGFIESCARSAGAQPHRVAAVG